MAEKSMMINSGINEVVVVIMYILFHDLLLQVIAECHVHGGLAIEYKTHAECRVEISSGADFIVCFFTANRISCFYSPKRRDICV